MKYPNRCIPAALAGLMLVACAGTKPVPHELADAREAYHRAVAGPGAELAPAQLHVANEALDRAEANFENDPEGDETKDLSYVAQRKSQLADSIANAELAKQQKAQAEKAKLEAHAEINQQTEQDLAKTREQLNAAQMQAKEALSKLSGLKDAVKQDARGLVITLSGAVLFGSGKSELLPAARKKLDDIAQALTNAKGQRISIEGYTDTTGSMAKNTDLSLERAQSVASYLTQKGIPEESVKAIGHGPANPVASNKTAEGRASNRRVEIVLQGEVTGSNN